MTLDAQIEAILFFKGEPISIKKLGELLSVREETVNEAVAILEEKLVGRGLTLIKNDGQIMLGTTKEAGEIIDAVKKDELSKDLGKAGVETLSIVLYQGPISRPDIDYIRGVNSSFILRNLMVRGLVERVNNPNDSRSYLYKPTFDLLAHLGISSIEELPEFESMKEKIEVFVAQTEDHEEINSPNDKTQEEKNDHSNIPK
jgi:segregation and condensation protein B